MRSIFTHVRANAVAYLALFFALGGTGAWAAATIGPGNIKPNAVRSKHIKAGQVRPPDTNLTKFGRAAGEVPFSAQQPLPSPLVRVSAKRGDLIVYHAMGTFRRVSGAGTCTVDLVFRNPVFEGFIPVFATTSASNDDRYLGGGSSGAPDLFGATSREFPVVTPGAYEFSFQVRSDPGTSCAINERMIWASIVR